MKRIRVYLDNSATTAVIPEVIREMRQCFSDTYGNASSFHYFGRQAKMALENSRAKIAMLLNANPEEVFFTGSGTESDNIAIFGTLNDCKKNGHIITSKVEHHAVLYSCKNLEKNGYEVTYLNVNNDGIISVDDFKKAIQSNTVIVSIMHANNEVGSIQPIEKIAIELKRINEKRRDKIYFHTDAVQTAGKLILDVEKLGIDLLAVSAHKLNGPKGVGALYVKKGTNISQIIFGGHHENGLRPGTENVPCISGFAKAFEFSSAKIKEHSEHIFALKKKLKNGILNAIPDVIINGNSDKIIPNILSVSFNYVEGESLLLMLDMKGIAVSTGSACASGSSEPSHVLSAMGIDPIAAQGTIRFSFGHQNTEEEIDYVLKVLPKVVNDLRLMSPVWRTAQRL
jgi:cysteine desulfurase